MKKLLLLATLLTLSASAFSANIAVGLVLYDGEPVENAEMKALGVLTSSSLTTVVNPVAGVIVFGDNGEEAINLAHPVVQDLLNSAIDKVNAGEELTEDEAAILAIVNK